MPTHMPSMMPTSAYMGPQGPGAAYVATPNYFGQMPSFQFTHLQQQHSQQPQSSVIKPEPVLGSSATSQTSGQGGSTPTRTSQQNEMISMYLEQSASDPNQAQPVNISQAQQSVRNVTSYANSSGQGSDQGQQDQNSPEQQQQQSLPLTHIA